MKKHLNITVKGKVQGVYFRENARLLANELNIKGFARNEPNKDVFIEAEGEEAPLQEFLKWCGTGSGQAEVKSVTYEEGEWKDHKTFKRI